MSYDPCTVFNTAVDSPGSSNAIVASAGRIYIHKVALRHTGATGSSAMAVLINDDAEIGTTNHVIALLTSSEGGVATFEYPRYKDADFNPPVPIERGLSIDLTGTEVSVSVYYTRA